MHLRSRCRLPGSGCCYFHYYRCCRYYYPVSLLPVLSWRCLMHLQHLSAVLRLLFQKQMPFLHPFLLLQNLPSFLLYNLLLSFLPPVQSLSVLLFCRRLLLHRVCPVLSLKHRLLLWFPVWLLFLSVQLLLLLRLPLRYRTWQKFLPDNLFPDKFSLQPVHRYLRSLYRLLLPAHRIRYCMSHRRSPLWFFRSRLLWLSRLLPSVLFVSLLLQEVLSDFLFHSLGREQ